MDWWGDEERTAFAGLHSFVFYSEWTCADCSELYWSIVLVHRPEMDNPAASIFIWKQSTHQGEIKINDQPERLEEQRSE